MYGALTAYSHASFQPAANFNFENIDTTFTLSYIRCLTGRFLANQGRNPSDLIGKLHQIVLDSRSVLFIIRINGITLMK